MTTPNLSGYLLDGQHQYLSLCPMPWSGAFMSVASEDWKCDKKRQTNDVNSWQSLLYTGFCGKRGTKIGISPHENPTDGLFCSRSLHGVLCHGTFFPIIWNIHWGNSHCFAFLRLMNPMEQGEC